MSRGKYAVYIQKEIFLREGKSVQANGTAEQSHPWGRLSGQARRLGLRGRWSGCRQLSPLDEGASDKPGLPVVPRIAGDSFWRTEGPCH
jgi:hypothetical protein